MTKTLCLLLLSQFLVFGTIDRIKKALEKKEYEKASELILKGYEKEPLNPGVDYYHATLLFDLEFAGYELDSARITIEKSKQKYSEASDEFRSELTEEGITEERINQLHDRIRDRAFQNTLNTLSLEKILRFQENFPNSIFQNILSFKKDSIEYKEASILNTQTALLEFIRKNPTSVFKPKADSILDGLRYKVLLENGSLSDYYQFIISYPFTRYNEAIESYILKVSTASHNPSKYVDFISSATNKALKKKAGDILYYLQNATMHHPSIDSIQQAQKVSNISLYPVMDQNQFGFYDQAGLLRINFAYSDILSDYKCEVTNDDWIFVFNSDGGEILTKDGKVIMRDIEDYESISRDLGLIKNKGHWFLYHKSGFPIIDDPVDGAEVLGNKWIKIERNGKFGLTSYLGYPIADIMYDDIFKEGSFWVFQKSELLAVYTQELILKEVEEKGLSLEFKFEDIELVNKDFLIGFRDKRECLLDSTLNFLVPWGEYEINLAQSGWYLKTDDGYRLYNQSEAEVMDQTYSYIESNEGWLAIQTENDWMLRPQKTGLTPSRGYDSIKLVNSNAVITIQGDERTLRFLSGMKIDLEDQLVKSFLSNSEFISISEESKKTLYNKDGVPIIDGDFEKITFLNDTLIKVEIRNKQGIMNIKGDWIINPVFESLDEKDGLILTLLENKIGCFDLSNSALIPAEYEARLEKINDAYLAKKNGKYGVISIGEESILPFDYDEIQQWNDSTFIVRTGEEFLIINKEGEDMYEPMESIELLLENNQNNIFRFIQNGRYGLLSNTFGELLNSEFTDIYNIGNQDSPLFFADQHLDKAGFHVVSYVNQYGDLILSKAYTKVEFDRILCDN
ncbi:hypothetical protein [Ekhidna sp.]